MAGARLAGRLAVVLAAAGLTAGCWQPLYGARPGPGGEGVRDKFAAVDIPPIAAPKGTPTERVAVGMRNALQFDLHNGGSPAPPIYALKVTVSSTQFTAYIDPNAGRPDSQIQIVIASYQLIELGTSKMVLNDMTIAHVDYDIPGSQQRFAGQRAARCGRSRHSSGGRRHPQPACVVLRRRDVISSDRGFSTVMRGLDPLVPIEQAMSCK